MQGCEVLVGLLLDYEVWGLEVFIKHYDVVFIGFWCWSEGQGYQNTWNKITCKFQIEILICSYQISTAVKLNQAPLWKSSSVNLKWKMNWSICVLFIIIQLSPIWSGCFYCERKSVEIVQALIRIVSYDSQTWNLFACFRAILTILSFIL